jgi:hypothetical protein
MSSFSGHFIGYARLEEWAEAISILDPVYACLIVDSEAGPLDIRNDHYFIHCAQPRGDTVHYFRTKVALVQRVNDVFLNEDHERRLERARQAWEIVREWLQERGFAVREALVAYPRDLKLLEGEAGFMGYDKERGYFMLANQPA